MLRIPLWQIEGKKRIDWAEVHMPVLVALKHKYESEKPLKGTKIAGCLHVTKETGVPVELSSQLVRGALLVRM